MNDKRKESDYARLIPEVLGMKLSVASLAGGSGHARLSAYPCELYSTRIVGRAAVVRSMHVSGCQCNALNLANTNARPPCPQTTLEAHARGGTLFTRGDNIHR